MDSLSHARRYASTAALAVAVALAVAAAAGCRAKTRPKAKEPPPVVSRPGRSAGEQKGPPPRVRPAAEPHDAAPPRAEQEAEPEDTAPPVRPSPRSEFAAAYAGGTRLVMFGGDGYLVGRKLGDTWEYDSRTHRWTQYEQRGEKPSPRSWPAMAYAGGTKVVMFGGHVGRGKGFVGDTWEYDVETHAWARVRPAGDSPSARGGHALAYLGGTKVLLFGGFNLGESEIRKTDTWEYDAAARAWRRIATKGKTPPFRGDYDMAWAGENKAVLFGGSYPAGKGLRHRADTWQYDATTQTWQEVAAPGPKGRCDHAMAGLGDGKILLMGGWQDRKDAIFRDVWEFDAAAGAWRRIERDGISPSRRHIHVMARAGEGKVVVFGGSSRTDETWEYDRATGRWTADLARRSMELAWTSKETNGTYCVAWADYDGDDDPDLAVGNKWGPGTNQLYRNDGGNLVLAWTAPIEDATESDGLAWGDFDGDGDPDLAVGNDFKQANRVYRNDGGELVPAWTSAEKERSLGVAWADVDGDGKLDLAVANVEGPNRLYRNTGGALELAWTSAEADRSEGLAWGDWDGDGDADLAVANFDVREPNRVYRNDGGKLVLAWSSPEKDPSLCVAWADWDLDGDLDLAVANENRPNRVYENKDGTLELAWSSREADATRAVAWGDWDGDGRPDLAAANEGHPNRIYRNARGELVLAWTSLELDGTISVAWEDIDGDGDLDLACGNKGPNRVYRNVPAGEESEDVF